MPSDSPPDCSNPSVTSPIFILPETKRSMYINIKWSSTLLSILTVSGGVSTRHYSTVMYERAIISSQPYSPPIAPTCKPQNQWVLWDMIPHSLVDRYQYIRVTYCLHLKKKTPSAPQNLGTCLQDNKSYTQKTHHHDNFKTQTIINFYLILWNLYTICLITLNRLKLHQACVISQEKKLYTGHLVLKGNVI